MLLPSILQILDQGQIQSKKIVKSVESGFEAEITAAMEGLRGLETIESAIADAADLATPPNSEAQLQEKHPAGQSLEELLRIINKFEKSNQKRVVDVFE